MSYVKPFLIMIALWETSLKVENHACSIRKPSVNGGHSTQPGGSWLPDWWSHVAVPIHGGIQSAGDCPCALDSHRTGGPPFGWLTIDSGENGKELRQSCMPMELNSNINAWVTAPLLLKPVVPTMFPDQTRSRRFQPR